MNTNELRQNIDQDLISTRINSSDATIILFGSVARNENNENSDIDVALISKSYTPSPKNLTNQNINITTYTEEKILKMASQGSLFVKHLLSEGIVIQDNKNFMKVLKQNYDNNSKRDKFINELLFSTKYLDINEEEYVLNWKRYNSLALYIFRSFLYLECDRLSINTFSISIIAESLNDKMIMEIYSLKYDTASNYLKFINLKKYIEVRQNIEIKNEYESYDALLVNSINIGTLPVWLGSKLRSDDGEVISYE